jgi:hypothetical protein
MKQKHAFLILSIACIPAILHAANLYINLINFPSFGDDFQYLQLVEYVQHHSIYENVNAIFQPHNQIHRIAYGRLMMLISYCFWGFIDFKWMTILANLQLLAIAIPIFLYLKKEKLSLWHMIPISFILFSPYGNLDNFGFIGASQHTGSMLFLVWISYGLMYAENKLWISFLALAYPFVSTEGLAFLPIVALCLWKTRSRLTYYFAGFAAIIILLYVIGLSVSEKSPITSPSILTYLIAFSSFLGLFMIKVSDTYVGLINMATGILVCLLLAFAMLKGQKRIISFPTLLMAQVMIVGILICIGRSSQGDLVSIVNSERFLFYGLISLIGLYLCCLSIPFVSKNPILLTGFAITYFTLSYFYSVDALENMRLRLRSDVTNAHHNAPFSSYSVGPLDYELINHRSYYSLPKNEIITIDTMQLRLTGKPIKIKSMDSLGAGKYRYKLENSLLNENKNKAQFALIYDLKSANKWMISPLLNNKKGREPFFNVHFDSQNQPSNFDIYIMELANANSLAPIAKTFKN